MEYYLEALKKYAVFTGRASRAEYWYFFLFNLLISVAIGFIIAFIKIDPRYGNLYNIIVFVPGVAVAIRRMHDVNKSGWYALIPFYNIVLAVTKGTEGENKYGPDPLEEEYEEYEEEDDL